MEPVPRSSRHVDQVARFDLDGEHGAIDRVDPEHAAPTHERQQGLDRRTGGERADPADGGSGQTFGQADVPQAYYYGIDCDSAFKMCAVAPNGDFNYDFVPMLTSCDGGRTWFDSPGVELGFLDVKVNADGGMMYSASDSRPTPTSPYYVWSFPLAA